MNTHPKIVSALLLAVLVGLTGCSAEALKVANDSLRVLGSRNSSVTTVDDDAPDIAVDSSDSSNISPSADNEEDVYSTYVALLEGIGVEEKRKLDEIVSYLKENDVDPDKYSARLEVPSFLTYNIGEEPYVSLSMNSNIEFSTQGDDTAFVFGMLVGELGASPLITCTGCDRASIEGHTFFAMTSVSKLVHDLVKADTSISSLRSSGYRQFISITGSPANMRSYVVLGSQFKGKSESVMSGFTNRFNHLGRNDN